MSESTHKVYIVSIAMAIISITISLTIMFLDEQKTVRYREELQMQQYNEMKWSDENGIK